MNQQSDLIPPAHKFDLTNWKLQELSTRGIVNLTKYASPCFFLTADDLICFDVDTAQEATSYRSELRHKHNWNTGENHEMSATLKVKYAVKNFRLTLIQIHGITDSKEFPPPVLRIVVINGNLFSITKKDIAAIENKKTLLKKNISDSFFDLSIKVENAVLTVGIDGKELLNQDISFWKYKNYFKIGCYPQTKEGRFQVYVKKFHVD